MVKNIKWEVPLFKEEESFQQIVDTVILSSKPGVSVHLSKTLY